MTSNNLNCTSGSSPSIKPFMFEPFVEPRVLSFKGARLLRKLPSGFPAQQGQTIFPYVLVFPQVPKHLHFEKPLRVRRAVEFPRAFVRAEIRKAKSHPTKSISLTFSEPRAKAPQHLNFGGMLGYTRTIDGVAYDILPGPGRTLWAAELAAVSEEISIERRESYDADPEIFRQHTAISRKYEDFMKTEEIQTLQEKWDDILCRADKDLQVLPGFKRTSSKRSADVAWRPSGTDAISYEGRYTTEHTDVNELRKWWALKYNRAQKKWTPELENEIIQHPDFMKDSARCLVELRGRTIQEALDELGLEQKPNALSQWFRRSRGVRNPYNDIRTKDYPEAGGNFVCVTVLNGRATVRVLCPGAEPEKISAALEREQNRSVRVALKNGKRDKLTAAELASAVERVGASYRDITVYYWLTENPHEDCHENDAEYR